MNDFSKNYSFLKMIFKEESLKKLNLPIVEYPIPKNKLEKLLNFYPSLNPSILIYWIMEYMNYNNLEREYYEKVLLDICEKHAPVSGQNEYWYDVKSRYAANVNKIWCLKLGNVDLRGPIVTFQKNKKIFLALAKSKEDLTKIEVTFFTAPNQDLIAQLRHFSIDKDIITFVKPELSDSFGYFQYLTTKIQYATNSDEITIVPVNWEYGLGWNTQNKFNGQYDYALNLNPIPNDWICFLFNIVLECEKNNTFEQIVGKQNY